MSLAGAHLSTQPHDVAGPTRKAGRVRSLLALAGTVFALPLLTACADPSHAAEADELRRALAELPGVTDVDLHYTEPVILDSGKLELRVDMPADADPGDVVEVVGTAYAAFSGTHHGEEGDLSVVIGDDTIHVRSFEPDAEVAAVEQAAERAIAVLPAGSVGVGINTQDVDESPYVFTVYAVTIAEQDADAVLRVLTNLERAHGDIPDAGWSVQTRDDESGWRLMSTSGFPTPQQRALFNQLRLDLPHGASILLADDFVTAQVPAEATPDQVSAMVGRHFEMLGGVEKAFYDVTSGENFYLLSTEGDCTFAPGAVGDRLRQDYGADCTKVTEPSP